MPGVIHSRYPLTLSLHQFSSIQSGEAGEKPRCSKDIRSLLRKNRILFIRLALYLRNQIQMVL